MLKLVKEAVGQDEFFTRITTLGMPEHLSNWSLQDKAYNHWGVTKEDIPELINIATDLELFDSELETERYSSVHAWRILSEIAAKDAIEPLIERFDDYYTSDWAYDELPKIIAAIGGVNFLDKITDHLFDKSKDEFSRMMAAEILKEISISHIDKANECIDIIVSCLDGSEMEFEDFNAMLISLLVDLQAVSKIDNIRSAFEENRVNIRFTGDIEDAEIRLGLRERRDTPPPSFLPDFEDMIFLHEEHCPVCNDSRNPAISIKIGRNDPCHCGSGKKYKKCCLE